jgi:hypothetical protein
MLAGTQRTDRYGGDAGSMAENEVPEEHPEVEAVVAEPVPAESTPATVPAAASVAVPVKFRDRIWSTRAMIAVAIATLLLGGVGGAAIAHHGNERHRMVKFEGPGGRGFEGNGGRGMGGYGGPGTFGNGSGFGEQGGQQGGTTQTGPGLPGGGIPPVPTPPVPTPSTKG